MEFILALLLTLLLFYLLSYNTWWTISTYPTSITLRNNWKILGKNTCSFEYKEIIIVDLIFYNWTGKILRDKPIIRISTERNVITFKGPSISEVEDLQVHLHKMGIKVVSDYPNKT